MARSLRAGLSIDQTIGIIGEHGVAPLLREFARMHRQLELGLALNQVLKMSSERMRAGRFQRLRLSPQSAPHDRRQPARADGSPGPQHARPQPAARPLSHRDALGRYGNVILFLMAAGLIAYLGFFQRDLAGELFREYDRHRLVLRGRDAALGGDGAAVLPGPPRRCVNGNAAGGVGTITMAEDLLLALIFLFCTGAVIMVYMGMARGGSAWRSALNRPSPAIRRSARRTPKWSSAI